MNQRDSEASGKALDSLLNFETVKYFNAEDHEIDLYSKSLGTRIFKEFSFKKF